MDEIYLPKYRCAEGVCPNCGGSLEYGLSDVIDEQVSYDIRCEECDFEGQEWYDLVFDGMSYFEEDKSVDIGPGGCTGID